MPRRNHRRATFPTQLESFVRMNTAVLVALSVLSLSFGDENEIICPPPKFATKQNFHVLNYIKNSWYPLKQLPVRFQREDSFYCVRAQYTLDTKRNWWCFIFRKCDRIRIKVFNQGRIGGIDGKVTEANLYGIAMDRNDPAKLKVAPKFLPTNIFGGPYWVLEAGTYSELLQSDKTSGFTSTQYDWAIITGGAPKIPSNGKCVTGTGDTNTNGIWLFSRQPIPPAGTVEKLETIAQVNGIDTSVLLPVTQEGCW